MKKTVTLVLFAVLFCRYSGAQNTNNGAETSISYKSRIGLHISGGIGFDKFPLFIDENGSEVNLSTGGGFGIGMEYGFRAGRKFDLAIGGVYQLSVLSENLTNADASFSRLVLTVTPSFVIPISNGRSRIKLGAGPSLYAVPKMKADSPEFGYDQLEFRYRTSAGYHVQALFETSVRNKASVSIGVRYTGVRYAFNQEESSMMITYPDVTKPTGAGIDLILGYNILF